MPTKAFALQLKQLADDGTFEGFASVYSVEDLGGDVVDPGAFTKTLAVGGPTRPLLWQHRDPVGSVDLVDTGSALSATGRLSLGIEQGRDALQLMRDGVVRGLSIGFTTVKESFVDNVRHLQELKLWEVSVVTFPMNQAATVTSVKAAQNAELVRAIRNFRNEVKKLR